MYKDNSFTFIYFEKDTPLESDYNFIPIYYLINT